MRKSLETINETDFFWMNKPKEIERVLLISSVDVSPLPYIIGCGIVEGLEKVGTIQSKLMFEKDWFRVIGNEGEFGDIGWDIYKDGKSLIIIVSAIHPIGNSNLWLFTYPLIRDTCDMAVRMGAKKMDILTTSHLNAFGIDQKTFSINDILKIDSEKFDEDMADGEGLLMPIHTWLMAWIFRELGGQSVIHACGGDKTNLITEEGLDVLTSIVEELGYSVERDTTQDLYDEFKSVEEEAKTIGRDVLSEYKKPNGKEEKGGVMFG